VPRLFHDVPFPSIWNEGIKSVRPSRSTRLPAVIALDGRERSLTLSAYLA
jgi:hypothetical protein